MTGTDETALVAALLPPPALAEAVEAAWESGEAILPLNAGAPAAELRRLLDALRPTHVVDPDGRRPHPGGAPVAAGVAAVVVTSGTTGAAKGVELTRAGLEVMGRGYSAALGAGPGDRWLACLPLHHVAGLAIVGRSWVTGVPYTVHAGFDLDRVARSADAEGTTIVSVVPTTLRRLLDAGAPLERFRKVIVGGAPCPPELKERSAEAGIGLVDAYGLTETWGGCVLDGVPIDGAEARIEGGEILVRGAMVTRGYRSADEPFPVDDEGWLHTGDLGVWDEGRLAVVDRRKDLVISGGVNVSPTEVEAVLARHPGVADVCVVGAPDPEWGERVVACVVPADPANPPTVEALREHARELLSPAKLPRELVVVDEIPRTPGGKPLRRVLRDR